MVCFHRIKSKRVSQFFFFLKKKEEIFRLSQRERYGKTIRFSAAAKAPMMLRLRTIKTHNLYTPFRTDTLLSRLLLLFYALGRKTIQRRKRKRKRTVSSAFGWLRCAPQISSSFFSFAQTHSSSISVLFLQTRRSNSWSIVMMSRRFASFSR